MRQGSPQEQRWGAVRSQDKTYPHPCRTHHGRGLDICGRGWLTSLGSDCPRRCFRGLASCRGLLVVIICSCWLCVMCHSLLPLPACLIAPCSWGCTSMSYCLVLCVCVVICASTCMVPRIPWRTVLVRTIVLLTWPGSAVAPQCSIRFHYYQLLYLVCGTYASGTITWADVALKRCISSNREHQGLTAWCASRNTRQFTQTTLALYLPKEHL